MRYVACRFCYSIFSKFFPRLFLVLAGIFDIAFGSGVCPTVCVCKWKSGKQSVECTNKALIAIPEGIDPETQLLDMSGNNLQVLPKETFIRAALLDLQKVYLRDCQIGQIDDRALQGLLNVVDLDLSRNLLTSVPSSIFEDVPNLRNLSLAHNPIQKVDAFAFRYVSALTKLDVSHCQVKTIASKAFEGIEFLEWLRLNGNKLNEMKLKTVETLSRLHGVELHENPWYCDCGLRALKIWLTEKHIPHPIEPLCSGGPTRIFNKAFNQLHADDFACKPEMKIKLDNRYVESTAGDNATVVCKVESVPEAAVNWYWNGRLLLNNSAFSSFQRLIILESGKTEKKSALILTNAQESDSSQFYCVAENQAGIAEANFTLRIVHRLAGFAVFSNGGLAGISVALILLIFSVLIVIVYLLFRIRKMPGGAVREIKHTSAVGDDTIPNGIAHRSRIDDKSLSVEPSAETAKAYPPNVPTMYSRSSSASETQTLPRIGEISYDTATAFVGREISQNTCRGTYRRNDASSNFDLIADTRYQDGGVANASQCNGEYTPANVIHYPSNLWNQNETQNFFKGMGSVEFGIDANDKTPIIEEVSFYETADQCSKSKDCEYSTASSPSGGLPSSISPTPPPPPPSSFTHPNAKTIRVWQKGVQVLPPVTALKRVLNRSSPDEGYQEGCGTDV